MYDVFDVSTCAWHVSNLCLHCVSTVSSPLDSEVVSGSIQLRRVWHVSCQSYFGVVSREATPSKPPKRVGSGRKLSLGPRKMKSVMVCVDDGCGVIG